MAAVPACAQSRARVRPGIDVLLSDSAHLVAGKRIGLITNQTGVDAAGVSTIDRLFRAPRTPHSAPVLVALFAPEHGIRGTARPGERINDTVDVATGIPIYSVYGQSRAPTPAQLESIDVLVVDLQDVGARTYTYISTAIYAMRAARGAGKRILVLDRPNPIGCAVQGPLLDTAYASFIGMLPVPLRHGMTMGEMARFANTELAIGADLVVVPVQGWRRCQWFDETGLPFIIPSPNLRDLDALAWYPGTVLLESTNLSVGRGTDAAFRQLGAPWLRPSETMQWLRFLNVRDLAQTTFTPNMPGDGKYADTQVEGIRLPQLDRRNGDPIAIVLAIVDFLARTDSGFRIDSVGIARRLGIRLRPHPCAPEWHACGNAWDGYQWARETAAFRRRSSPYLLYR